MPMKSQSRWIALRLIWITLSVICFGNRLWAEDFWELVSTDTVASLRGLSPVDRTTAWTCGSQATLLRTIDGGRNWTRVAIEGLDAKTELRSIHAWSAEEAVVATAGSPCRIYRTRDAGRTWRNVYENTRPEAFIDALRFWDQSCGFAFGDPIDGKLMALMSDDRGQSWRMPGVEEYPLRELEAGFAASNSGLLLFGERNVWIGLGGASGPAQVLNSSDRGSTWKRDSVSPIPSGKTSGVFSLARSHEGVVVAVGGDYTQVDRREGNIARWDPAKAAWEEVEGAGPSGYRSSVIFLSKPIGYGGASTKQMRWICVGPNGCDGSEDARDWFVLSRESFHALAVAGDGSIWACGGQGRVGLHLP